MTSTFSRYELRTTDAEGARAFYAKLLGHEHAIVWPLHEQARARGAMPHWLGSIGVEDVQQLERVSEEFVQRGATTLGPVRPAADGGHAAVLRDPGGAIVGVATPPLSGFARTVDVAWQVLNTNDLAAAIVNYRALFGWSIDERPSHGPDGAFYEFRWEQDSAGAMADLAGRPGVHPHWLFFFNVKALDAAVELTRREGGTAIESIHAGEWIAVCEDPQGAAFGLMERR
jgi:uncharacterized protein